jgi:hypothetical protein
MELRRGVVEDNKDPEELGRVKVRIFGMHTADQSDAGGFGSIDTDHLPWAEVIGGTGFGLVGGAGLSSVLRQGTWVWVTFELNNPNRPIVVGTMAGKSSAAGEGGFSDPDGKFPSEERIGQSDISGVSRGDMSTSVIGKIKNANLDTAAPAAYTEVAQEASTYPDSTVIESWSGHIFELDDTEGAERIQLIDRQGNYIEMKVGEFIEKAVQDRVNLIMGQLKEHIVGDAITINDANVTWKIGGNLTIEVGGVTKIVSTGVVDVNSSAEIDMDAPKINLN